MSVYCDGAAGDLERRQRVADRDVLADGSVQGHDRAGERAWDLDRGLGGLDLDEGLVQLDGVARCDQPFDDLAFLEALAEVGHDEHRFGISRPPPFGRPSTMRSTLGR